MDGDNNNNGETPLWTASQNGDVDLVRLLIDVEALINQAKNSGATPILAASQDGHVDVVRLLIDGGATVKIDTMMRYTQKKPIYS